MLVKCFKARQSQARGEMGISHSSRRLGVMAVPGKLVQSRTSHRNPRGHWQQRDGGGLQAEYRRRQAQHCFCGRAWSRRFYLVCFFAVPCSWHASSLFSVLAAFSCRRGSPAPPWVEDGARGDGRALQVGLPAVSRAFQSTRGGDCWRHSAASDLQR